jgi:large subunit ribosomal protein L21
MYAVVKIGSLQYKVAEGETVHAFRLGDDEGKGITLDKVLLYANGSDIRVGQPYLKDVKVTATVARHFKDDKVMSFQFKKRKGVRVKKGYRQALTAINITKISA